MHTFVIGDGGIDVGGEDADEVAHFHWCLGYERYVLVGHDHHETAAIDVGVAVVHAQGLDAAVRDSVPGGGCRDDRGEHAHRLLEGQAQLCVRGVHQRVRAGLDLVGIGVDVERAGAACGDDVAADGRVFLQPQLPRLCAE